MKYQIISEREFKNNVNIRRPDEVYALVKRYAEMKQEQFILLTLNSIRDVISVSYVSIGNINTTIVHPREVFCKAISDRASQIIICHNHPSGSLKLSKEDRALTRVIYKAGKIIQIPLIDHIIFTKTAFISLHKEGKFPKEKGRL